MSDEAAPPPPPDPDWLDYAGENLQLAELALQNGLLNPSLQNAQQAVEKALKAVWVGLGRPLRKTHCIADLAEDLASAGLDPGLAPEECHLLDSIYLPSKYPAMSVLPDAMPDKATCRRCIEIAEKALGAARRLTKHL